MRQINRVGVLGAGVMGATIAAHLANAGLDPALIAEIFTLPGESYLADNMETVDIDGIHYARRNFIKQLAAKLEKIIDQGSGSD